jgi:hypothetical protein
LKIYYLFVQFKRHSITILIYFLFKNINFCVIVYFFLVFSFLMCITLSGHFVVIKSLFNKIIHHKLMIKLILYYALCSWRIAIWQMTLLDRIMWKENFFLKVYRQAGPGRADNKVRPSGPGRSKFQFNWAGRTYIT